MKKRDLIRALSQLPGNPEVLVWSWNGDVDSIEVIKLQSSPQKESGPDPIIVIRPTV